MPRRVHIPLKKITQGVPKNLKAFFRIRNLVYAALKTAPNHRGVVVGVTGSLKHMKQAISALSKCL